MEKTFLEWGGFLLVETVVFLLYFGVRSFTRGRRNMIPRWLKPTQKSGRTPVSSERISTLQGHRSLLGEVLDTAVKRVIISSPLASPVALWSDKLPGRITRAVGRGVKVKVYVDDPVEGKSGEVKENAVRGIGGIDILLNAGAEVYVVQGIHRKTLIRDNDLIAEGSFNWLSAVREEGHKHQRMESSIVQRGNVGATLNSAVKEMEKLGYRISISKKEGRRATPVRYYRAGLLMVDMAFVALICVAAGMFFLLPHVSGEAGEQFFLNFFSCALLVGFIGIPLVVLGLNLSDWYYPYNRLYSWEYDDGGRGFSSLSGGSGISSWDRTVATLSGCPLFPGCGNLYGSGSWHTDHTSGTEIGLWRDD